MTSDTQASAALLQQAIDYNKNNNPKAATKSLKKLIEQYPEDIRGYDLLLSTHRDEINTLIPYLQAHLESHPNCMPCYDYLRYAYTLSNQEDDLILYLNSLFIRFPNNAEPLYQLAEIYDGKGNRKLAKEYLNDAFQRSPNDWHCQNLMAAILLKQGAFDEAEHYYTLARESQPDNPLAISGLADILYARGEYQHAHELLSLFMDKHHEPHPSISKSFLKVASKVGQEALAITQTEALLNNPTLALRDGTTISLYGDLARLYDRRGDYKKAFEYMHHHNQMAGSHWNEQQTKSEIEFTKKHYNQALLSQPINTLPTQPTPIFIVGFPRSGTTLVEQIISSHPEVCGAGELTAMSHINNYLINGANSDELYNNFISSLAQNDKAREQLIIHYLQDVQSQTTLSKAIYTDKMPSNFLHLGLIRLLFPSAPIIHCRRDPLDCCVSNYFQQFSEAHSYSNDLKNLAKYYNLYLEMMDHWSACNINLLNIDYEALVANQEQVSRGIIEHCQLNWDDNCLNFHEQSRFVGTASAEQVTQSIYSHSVGRWKNYQNEILPLIETLAITPQT